jgi:exonuclease III
MLIMKITSWNIRGMKFLYKQIMMKKKIPMMKADIVLLQETKYDEGNIRRITQRIWLGCESRWIVAEGASRGISTLWDLEIIDMEDMSSRPMILTLKFKSIGS